MGDFGPMNIASIKEELQSDEEKEPEEWESVPIDERYQQAPKQTNSKRRRRTIGVRIYTIELSESEEDEVSSQSSNQPKTSQLKKDPKLNGVILPIIFPRKRGRPRKSEKAPVTAQDTKRDVAEIPKQNITSAADMIEPGKTERKINHMTKQEPGKTKRTKSVPWSRKSYKARRFTQQKKSSSRVQGWIFDCPESARDRDRPENMKVGRGEDGQYEVEEVLGERVVRGQMQYLVKWRGWPDAWNTWTPDKEMTRHQQPLLEYYRRLSQDTFHRVQALNGEIAALRLPGKLTLQYYESNLVFKLTDKDFKGLKVDSVAALCESLPSPKLLSSHISRLLQLQSEGQSSSKLEGLVRRMVLSRELVRRRHEQLEALDHWAREMRERAGESAPLSVENNVDLEGPQAGFECIPRCIPGPLVTIPEDPPVGCECSPLCSPDSPCCYLLSCSSPAYSPLGLLLPPPGTPVYECNKRCTCAPDCTNRVLQNGRTIPLTVFRTPNHRGWGVKVQVDVEKGTFLCEYTGEVITRETAEVRLNEEYKDKPLYIFDLDFNDKQDFPYSIDAYKFGNVSHFINHSCEPNLAVYSVWVDCLDPNLPRLGLYALRDIGRGEELTFDYLGGAGRGGEQVANRGRARGKVLCKCGSAKCRGVLF